jgi:hypothetical protein
MADDNAVPAPKPSWHEREIAQALQRLANARAQLATLEEQAAEAPARPDPDPADVARARSLQADITKLTAKASGRFGGSGARAKLADAQAELAAVLDRIGVADLDELAAGGPSAPTVDPTVLDFARRECADAEEAFLAVAAMVIPDAEDEPEQPDAEVIAAADTFGDDADLDLRIEPSAS